MKADKLVVEHVPIDSVHPDPANARVHDQRNLDVIRGSLARFGQQKPIVVTEDSVIRAGNGTWQAAKALGWTEIAVVRTTLKGAEAMAFSLVDNRSTDLSRFEPDMLNAELSALAEDGWKPEDLEALGFGEGDMEEILAQFEGSAVGSNPESSGSSGNDEQAPDEFKEVDENVATEYHCPKCGYEWSGKPK